MSYAIVPITSTKARQFVQEHHRHNEAPSLQQITLCVGLEHDGELVAVATAGYPVARGLSDGFTLEVNRVCVRDVHRNANSRLYGAIGRAAAALGYRRLVTYTLVSEGGDSLRASGFHQEGKPRARSWERESPGRPRMDYTIWGERRQAQDEAKYRWERAL